MRAKEYEPYVINERDVGRATLWPDIRYSKTNRFAPKGVYGDTVNKNYAYPKLG